MSQITVIKRNLNGQETWRYRGKVLEWTESYLLLEAYFDREDMTVSGLPLRRGDRFIERYYFDRWYNIFAIHSREDGSLRGWYCNISRPAEREGQVISYVDLALDLIVFPDGRQVVLDEDEFAKLPLSEEDRAQARAALEELQALFRSGSPLT